MVNLLETNDKKVIQPILDRLFIPPKNSHKGINGRLLVIGGSSLFHSASIWAAEIASRFVDIVHYSSTKENQAVILNLKSKFMNGIVVKKETLPDYLKEDDAVLIGCGMVRNNGVSRQLPSPLKFSSLQALSKEADYTYYLTKYLLENYCHKKIILDAGSLQMMRVDWLENLPIKPILTPHKKEFENLFSVKLDNVDLQTKVNIVAEKAKKYRIVILLKIVDDIISDGQKTYVVRGGNAGLVKGGSGDILSGLAASLAVKNNSLDAAVLASYLIKKTADLLFKSKGYWYNNDDIMSSLPMVFRKLISYRLIK